MWIIRCLRGWKPIEKYHGEWYAITMTDILIIEDDEELRGLLLDFMMAEGLCALGAGTAEEGMRILEKEPVGLLLLDVMLPGIDGFAACGDIRKKRDLPIILMSARGDEESKLTGFRLGADDYIDKPVSAPVLTAKVKALLHRSGKQTGQKMTCGSIVIDTEKQQVYRDRKLCEIRGKLYELLLYMMENKGRLLTKEELYNAVWGDAFVEQATLNVHIRWLRERLEEDPANPVLIRTVWRKGFLFGEEI